MEVKWELYIEKNGYLVLSTNITGMKIWIQIKGERKYVHRG